MDPSLAPQTIVGISRADLRALDLIGYDYFVGQGRSRPGEQGPPSFDVLLDGGQSVTVAFPTTQENEFDGFQLASSDFAWIRAPVSAADAFRIPDFLDEAYDGVEFERAEGEAVSVIDTTVPSSSQRMLHQLSPADVDDIFDEIQIATGHQDQNDQESSEDLILEMI